MENDTDARNEDQAFNADVTRKVQNELGWLVRYEECVVNSCPEDDFPPMPLPIPPGYTKKNGDESGNGQKGFITTFVRGGFK